MEKEDLEELRKMLKKLIEDEEVRESFENFKKRVMPKPNFKIYMESDEKGEGCKIEVEGNRPSIMLALAHLSNSLLEQSNLTKSDILEAIETGLEED